MKPKISLNLFFGDSAQSRKLLDCDWKSTNLGNLTQWPKCLNNALRNCFNCPYPAFVLWGKEHLLFYNDDYQFFFQDSSYISSSIKPASLVWSDFWAMLHPYFKNIYT